jgi:pimeloyl-ACP methyl ester carboxylesterase
MPTLKTSLLEIAYKDEGPPEGPAVLLLHGWPDDASTWDAVAPALHDAGLRTITPMLRGFGNTRFLSSETARTGNAAILALDAIEMLDALGVDAFSVAGHDWGANVAGFLAAGWADRVVRAALLSSTPALGGLPSPPLWHARLQWYQWFQSTRAGAEAVRTDPKGFARMMWETWSPAGWFTSSAFDQVACSFENPDWTAVTLHSYRSRWGEAPPDPAGAWLDEKVRATRTLALPTIYFQGELDGVNPPAVSERLAERFIGPFERIMLSGVGHFPTREAPNEVAERLAGHFKTPA